MPFDVLGDFGNHVATDFGVAFSQPPTMRWVYEEIFEINLPEYNGDESWSLPMPARFVMDQNGMVRDVVAHLDPTIRPETPSAVDIVKRLVPRRRFTAPHSG